MQINGKIFGDFEIKRVRYHEKNNLREAIVILKTKVRLDTGKKIWGDDFMGVAFCGLFEKPDGSTGWKCEKLNKPNLVCEVHHLVINGLTIEVQPEIPKIIMVKDEPSVIVPLTMRIDLKTEKLAGKVTFACDKTTELAFDAKQLATPGSNANVTAIRTRPGEHGNPEPVRA